MSQHWKFKHAACSIPTQHASSGSGTLILRECGNVSASNFFLYEMSCSHRQNTSLNTLEHCVYVPYMRSLHWLHSTPASLQPPGVWLLYNGHHNECQCQQVFIHAPPTQESSNDECLVFDVVLGYEAFNLTCLLHSACVVLDSIIPY